MPEFKLTIVFRGLIVFNRQGTNANNYFEAGILYGVPDHFFRIHVVKNGVLETVRMISKKEVEATRTWEIKVANPVNNGIDTECKDPFIRNKPETFARDFRYLIDLEDAQFHDDLTGKIDTSILTPVIRVPYGNFYTRLKSRPLILLKNDKPLNDQYGNISVAIGCDIAVRIDNPRPFEPVTVAELQANGTTIFEFEINPNEPDTIYEIVNAPSDVFEHKHESDAPHDHGRDSEFTNTTHPTVDHFKYYYRMFGPHVDEFGFEEQPTKRGASFTLGPRPTLCGAVLLGKRADDL